MGVQISTEYLYFNTDDVYCFFPVRKGVTFSITEENDDVTKSEAKENLDPEPSSTSEPSSSNEKLSAKEKRIKESKIVDADEEVRKMEEHPDCVQQ